MKRFSTLALLLLGACTAATPEKPAEDTAALHKRLLVLDTHLDTPLHFGRPGWSFGDRHDPATDIAQVDMGRMEEGALDGGFFVIYTDQGPLTAKGYADALAFARGRSDAIDTTLAQFRDRILPATTAEEARRYNAAGKLIAFKSMENSYALGEDLTLLAEFHKRGVRMAGPVHGKNNQFADSSGDKPRWNGLSPLGRQWVAEMNRLGMVIDASHSSDAAFDQMLAASRAPIILSHSSGRAAYDHPRNLDDTRLRALAAKGGAICISTIFLSEINLAGERGALFAQYEKIATLTPAEQAELVRKWRELDKTQPLWDADFEKYMAMVLYVVKVAGPDHVCFSGDWDGGGGVKGFEDISALPLVTARLKAAGYSDEDLAKMWGGNILRIVAEAQAKAEG
ncbi:MULTISPECIES: dipeptidase [unclassified Sphingomonas]|uniref:dipeptidase n=1 Tax=unclassified Sphingomonas TaxID=196159 RepID=UPI0021508FCA|nr:MULTISPECIES: dipeptidase [unclassified Sphingomonas]MCR5870221.1 dipeptidase [Sphingomonas sp. J344]UUX98093.1 dipeptidase [Sphingomonas sp. J315]